MSWIRNWSIWSLPAAPRVLVLGVILTGAGALLASLAFGELPLSDAPLALILIGLGIAHVESSANMERARIATRRVTGAACWRNLWAPWSLWSIAAAIALPNAWSGITFVAINLIATRHRRRPGAVIHRFLYSRSAEGLSVLAAVTVMTWSAAAGWLDSDGVLVVVALGAALLAALATNVLLGAAAMHLAERTPWRMTITGTGVVIEVVVLSIGALIGVMLSGPSPWLVALMAPVVLFLHMALGAYERETQVDQDRDAESGLLNVSAWYRAARRDLRRARRWHQPRAVLLVRFDGIGPTPELLSDQLAAVLDPPVDDLTRAVRAGSLGAIGWTERDQIGVLLHDPQLMSVVAARLVEALTVAPAADGVATASSPAPDTEHPPVETRQAGSAAGRDAVLVGGACTPEDGDSLEELLEAAGRALRSAATSDGVAIVLRPASEPDAVADYRAARSR